MSAAPSLNELLGDFNRDVSREQPSDLIQWGADWFQTRLRKDRSAHAPAAAAAPPIKRGPPGSLAFGAPSIQSMHAPAPSPFSETGPSDSPFGGPRRATVPTGGGSNLSSNPLFASPFGNSNAPTAQQDNGSPFSDNRPVFDSSPFGQMEQHHDEPNVPSYALGRRTSVSAESLVPANQRTLPPSGLGTTLEEDEDSPGQSSIPVFPKSDEQLNRIRTAIKPNFLFRNLDEEQEADVLAAMKEVQIGAGEMIIEQGAAGDFFYVVESGQLDVYVKREGQVLEESKGDRAILGKKVATCVEGNSFGELALMHNAPRAASIVSQSPCTLWALDRVSFRTILLDHTSRKRHLYESFLSEVPILASLQPQERAKIADVLESRTFVEGEDVIREGDAGEEFFLIESGTAAAIKGNDTILKQYTKGDYFGELALLNRQARAASVRATSVKLVVATLGEQAFTRLLGPVKDIMARSVGERTLDQLYLEFAFILGLLNVPKSPDFYVMYHLLKGLHAHLTRKDEYSVVIIGLDNAGKTTMLEKIKTLYNSTPGMAPEKIGPTVGQNIGKINLPSTTLHFFDLGGQRDIRSIWPRYYDECHAVVFVLDACDQARLSEGWEVFDEVLNSPRLLNLPLLLLANKQDSPSSLSVSEIRESFDAWQRAHPERRRAEQEARDAEADAENSNGGKVDRKGKDKAKDEEPRADGWDDDGAVEERMASLDVMGVSALEGTGVRDAVNWLYIRVQNARKMF